MERRGGAWLESVVPGRWIRAFYSPPCLVLPGLNDKPLQRPPKPSRTQLLQPSWQPCSCSWAPGIEEALSPGTDMIILLLLHFDMSILYLR